MRAKYRSSTSGEGFTLVETLISMVITLLALGILIGISRNVDKELSLLSRYFSESKPLDSRVYALQMMTVISDYLLKKRGASIPSDIGRILSEELDFHDVGLTIFKTTPSDPALSNFEVIVIEATYLGWDGEAKRMVKKILRRK